MALKEDLIDLVRKEVLEKLSQSKLPEAVKVLWVGLDLHRFHEKSGDIRFIEVPRCLSYSYRTLSPCASKILPWLHHH